jgi:uncharacterized repeat protein (TIGR04138 family)
MQEVNFDEMVREILVRDGRYHPDAYVFLREGLDFTQKLISKEIRGATRHVTGQELLDGLRQYALQEFGPMAKMLLAEWGVRECRDFGNIVFNMVEIGLLAKTDRDSHDDFQNGYDFTEALCKPFWPAAKINALNAPDKPLAK